MNCPSWAGETGGVSCIVCFASVVFLCVLCCFLGMVGSLFSSVCPIPTDTRQARQTTKWFHHNLESDNVHTSSLVLLIELHICATTHLLCLHPSIIEKGPTMKPVLAIQLFNSRSLFSLWPLGVGAYLCLRLGCFWSSLTTKPCLGSPFCQGSRSNARFHG